MGHRESLNRYPAAADVSVCVVTSAPRSDRAHGGSRRPGCDDAGLTLIEILMATVIMLIIAMGTITALMFSGQATATTAQRTRGLNLANQYIEKARNLPYDRIGTNSDGGVYGDPPGDIHTPEVVDDFTVDTKISWQRDASKRSQYKNVEVTVTWTRPISGSVKLTTSIFGKTNLTNVGDLELTLKDHDGTSPPITGVDVTIVPQDSIPRTVRTDANGVAYFGRLPTGQVAVTMNGGDWVFDKSVVADFPAVSVATGDVLSSFTIKGQKPTTLRVRVVGTHSDGLQGATVGTVVMGQARSGVADADGYVTFTMVPHGTYVLTATCPHRDTVTSSVVALTPTPVSQPLNVSITMHDPASIQFRVTDASNADKAGATVTLYTQAGAAVDAGTSQAGGLVTLEAPTAGSYYAVGALGADSGRHPSATGTFITVAVGDYGNDATPIGTGAGGLVIKLAPSTGTFNITTRDSGYGNPIRPGGRILIVGPGTVNPQTRDVTTDSSGKITVSGLPFGSYTFQRRRTDGTGWSSSAPTLNPSGSPKTLSASALSLTFEVLW